ncbi:MAG TPA: YraN family protein [Actinophytocola sp.]|uniref:YraN family protein n=1 Tax=Actinophytocola sp. TaxID=1872138 RepID=UPI002DDCA520|nr:YraN family protein [Actinophytocola sp.]HEV2783495.1 YraN family protein [Actinophytocola sp.]
MSSTAAPTHLTLGRRGEDLAARYLEEHKGLVVLSRNWRCREGELDLVATDGHTLVVCEVKTRTSTDYGAPAEAVTETKARRIRRLTRRWLRAHQMRNCPQRFDIVSVLWPPGQTPRIKHLPGVL